MSWLTDTTELVSGGWLTSAYAGHGILAEDIPSTGEHGASVLFDQISLPADAGKELRALILTEPTGLPTWYQDEDGAVEAEGPDGSYSYSIQVYVDGVALGTPKTVTLVFGAAGASVEVAVTGGGGTLAIVAESPVLAAAAITGSPGALSVVAGSAAEVMVAIQAGPGTLAAAAESPVLATLAIQGGAGELAVAAGSGAGASVAMVGAAGTLHAEAGAAALVAVGITGSAGELAAAAGVPPFVSVAITGGAAQLLAAAGEPPPAAVGRITRIHLQLRGRQMRLQLH